MHYENIEEDCLGVRNISTRTQTLESTFKSDCSESFENVFQFVKHDNSTFY